MAKSTDGANRVVFLDYIRGIAALLVVCSHSFEAFIPSFHSIQINNFNLGIIGVVAFFIVSGFIIPFSLERYKSIKLFAISRVFRIYPLYLAIFIITLTLFRYNIIGEWILTKGYLLHNIIINLFFLDGYIPEKKFHIIHLVAGSWTLFIEMIWYIIFAILFKLRLNKSNILLAVSINVVLMLLTIASFYFNIRIPPGRYIMLFCCFVGLFAYRYFNKEISSKEYMYISSVSFINIYLALYVGFDHYKSETFSPICIFTSYTIGFLICFLLYFFKNNFKGIVSFILRFLGKISFSLYLIHPIVFLVLEKIGNNPFFSILTIILSIFFANFLYLYVEKPGVQLGRKIANL